MESICKEIRKKLTNIWSGYKAYNTVIYAKATAIG